MLFDFFICHASEDYDHIKKLKKELEFFGKKVCLVDHDFWDELPLEQREEVLSATGLHVGLFQDIGNAFKDKNKNLLKFLQDYNLIDQFKKVLEVLIDQSHIIVACITENFLNNDWCDIEMNKAVNIKCELLNQNNNVCGLLLEEINKKEELQKLEKLLKQINVYPASSDFDKRGSVCKIIGKLCYESKGFIDLYMGSCALTQEDIKKIDTNKLAEFLKTLGYEHTVIQYLLTKRYFEDSFSFNIIQEKYSLYDIIYETIKKYNINIYNNYYIYPSFNEYKKNGLLERYSVYPMYDQRKFNFLNHVKSRNQKDNFTIYFIDYTSLRIAMKFSLELTEIINYSINIQTSSKTHISFIDFFKYKDFSSFLLNEDEKPFLVNLVECMIDPNILGIHSHISILEQYRFALNGMFRRIERHHHQDNLKAQGNTKADSSNRSAMKLTADSGIFPPNPNMNSNVNKKENA